MSLERVKNTVIDAARAKAGALLADAEKESGRLVSEGVAANERRAADAVRDAKLRFERETNRELERLQYENRLAVLAAKNTAIAEVFKRVKDALSAMSDDEYVGMVGKWLSSLPPEAGGSLRVNPKDVDKFSARLSELNKGRKGSSKFDKVAPDPRVGSGAVVEGAEFAVDCTVERRIEELRETAVGDLAKILFHA